MSEKAEPGPDEAVRVRVVRMAADPVRPPKAFHKSFFVALQNDAVLEFGFLDLAAAHGIVEAARAGALPPGEHQIAAVITDTFVMTPQSTVDLLVSVNKLVAHFQKRGLLPSDLDDHSNWLQSASE